MALNRPENVKPVAELEATCELVELARRRKVLLPLSSGHYIEAGPLYDRRRRDLAPLIVGLSSGWVMRDPLTVRMHELVVSFQANGNPVSVCKQLNCAIHRIALTQAHWNLERRWRSPLSGPRISIGG
jgi:hypothetical protein